MTLAVSTIPLANASAADGARSYVPGQLIVKFRDGATSRTRLSSLRAVGVGEARSLGRTGAQRLSVPEADVGAALARLRSDPAVEYAEPNYVYHFADVPDDSLFTQQWALRNTGQTGGTPGADINAVRAWDVSAGSGSVLVAIIDSGLDIHHPDLASNLYINPSEIPNNGVDDDADQLIDDVHGWDFASGSNDPVDWMSHGTHVAGIVGAMGNNHGGTSGIAWHVRLLPLKVADAAGDLPLDAAIQAIDYAVSKHARIINASWGGPDSSEALRQSILAANAAGILFVAAAGNFFQNNDLIPYYPANFEIPNVISVASTDKNDQLAAFSSNWGPATVDLGAPGQSILSTVPGGGYSLRSGTSMAAPYVTGTLALMLSVTPTLTAAQAKAQLLASVHPDPFLTGKVRTGGRLDAFAAIASHLVSLTDNGTALPGLSCGSAAWADFNGDGKPDFATVGSSGASSFARIYRNTGAGAFTDIGAAVAGVTCGTVAWGDYDRDGDVDLLVTGLSASGPSTTLYRNDAGSFTPVATGLPGVQAGAAAWGDFDNDGDLDLALTGESAEGDIAGVYRNDGGGVFTDIGAGLTGVASGAVAWMDVDGDGSLDLVLAGDTGAGSVARVYHNDEGVFTDTEAALPGVRDAMIAVADFDNDGDPDLLLAGRTGTGSITRIYRNDAGSFTDAGAVLPGISGGSAAWADYDNDGDSDLLLAGTRDSAGVSVPYAHVFANDGGGSFRPIGLSLAGTFRSAVAWADIDNDGDLDLLQAGDTGSGSVLRVYRSSGAPANSPPSAPYGLSASVGSNQLNLSWSSSFDSKTPPSALSYNVRVGTAPLQNDVVTGMANAVTGYHQVVQAGNAGQRRSFKVALRPGSHAYYWSVGAIDGAFAASRFAGEQTLVLSTLGVSDGGLPGVSFAPVGGMPIRGRPSFRLGLPSRARVELSIHDVAGRRLAVLADGVMEAGEHTLAWPAGSDAPAPGVYFARLAVDGRTLQRSIVTLR